MALAFIENGSITKYPIGLVEVRRKFPNTSFPRDLEGSDLSAFGVVTVHNVASPTVDQNLQRIEEGEPAEIDGVWQQVWNVIDLTAQEIQQRADAKASQVRTQRNELLAAYDWTQMPDSPLDLDSKAAWALYRETLRMIPQQAGFPWNVQWPPVPGAS